MKAASGELSLTVITIIAIGAVLTFFWAFWPTIKNSVTNQWNNVSSRDTETNQQGYIVLPELYK